MGMNPIEFLNEYLSSSIRDIQKENARREFRKQALTSDGKRNWQYTDPAKPYYVNTGQNNPSVDSYTSARQAPVLPQETLEARASEGYNNWLKNSTQFQLNGREYRWAKGNDNLPMNNLYGDSEAERLAMRSLIEQKRTLSNGNYIPIPM